jgi:hypothetical protein
MKVYDGSSWIAASSAGTASLLTYRYIATSSQTTFSGSDAGGSTLAYAVSNIIVMQNGVTLDSSDYTATNGTSVVLNVGATTGDIINIVAFKSFNVAAVDAANKAAADLKAKQEAEAKAAADLKAKQEAEAKAAADKAAEDLKAKLTEAGAEVELK